MTEQKSQKGVFFRFYDAIVVVRYKKVKCF